MLNDEDKSTTATYMIHPCKEILSSAVHVRITYFYEKKLYILLKRKEFVSSKSINLNIISRNCSFDTYVIFKVFW